MKKLIALLLALVCALGLVGCNKSQPEYEEPNFTEIQTATGDTYSDFDGISIQASGIYISPDKTTITINWRNDTAYSAIYGETYSIERFENGEWVSCALKDNSFTAIAYELPAKKLESRGYTLTGMYEVNKPGLYRFLSSCSVYAGGEQPTECCVWAEFTVE